MILFFMRLQSAGLVNIATHSTLTSVIFMFNYMHQKTELGRFIFATNNAFVCKS